MVATVNECEMEMYEVFHCRIRATYRANGPFFCSPFFKSVLLFSSPVFLTFFPFFQSFLFSSSALLPETFSRAFSFPIPIAPFPLVTSSQRN